LSVGDTANAWPPTSFMASGVTEAIDPELVADLVHRHHP
jgi:hypothetical protein